MSSSTLVQRKHPEYRSCLFSFLKPSENIIQKVVNTSHQLGKFHDSIFLSYRIHHFFCLNFQCIYLNLIKFIFFPQTLSHFSSTYMHQTLLSFDLFTFYPLKQGKILYFLRQLKVFSDCGLIKTAVHNSRCK